MRLKGKTAIVTGAASGIGRDIATRFAHEGAHVVIADVNPDGTDVANTIQQSGGEAIAVVMDVTDEASVEAGVVSTLDAYGGVDILVSNAGVQHIAAVHELEPEAWRRMLSVHLDGAFLTTRACLQRMYAAGRGGSIIYMGSVHSKDASVLKAPYVTAKHGLLGLCRVVAKEGAAHGVRANVICPGFVRTALVEKQIPEQARDLGLSEEDVVRQVMLKNTVDGEFTTTHDVAELAVFFAGFETNALTGQALVVSHGWFME
jgi:3-hydroxybutyrate dehydrogenase